MDQRTIRILFSLLRSAICGTRLSEDDVREYSPELLEDLLKVAKKHDVAHLLALGLKQNGLLSKDNGNVENHIFKALYRYEQIRYEHENLCDALEKAEIAFIPLKGSIIREYYPEPWMRTSCDIDVLVHQKDLDRAVAYLTENLQYTLHGRATHDVSLFTPVGVHVELHFDLVEEGRANDAIEVLSAVWENVSLLDNKKYWYVMSDAYFYFYHIAHMAKHFESGGCGIRPFIDLWILDHMENVDQSSRDALLISGGLGKFTTVCRELSEVWLEAKEPNQLSIQMEDFLLNGGAYGSAYNRVALKQTKKGGRFGYILSRIFIPYAKLKRYYPVLDKHPWLMPIMQIRRWFMLLNPEVASMVKREMSVNKSLNKTEADEMNEFLDFVGLN